MNDIATTITKTTVQEGVVRDIGTIKTEITTLWQSAVESELSYAIRLGHKLTEAKQLLEHGQWGPWVEQNLPFSHRKANVMMQIYENYGSSQESLFGEINSQTYANLGISQAFALLEVPKEEREEFVKETHAEEMSVRELKNAIRERDEAIKKAEEAEQAKLRALSEASDLRQSNVNLKMQAQTAEQYKKDAAAAKAEAAKAKNDAKQEIAKVKEEASADTKKQIAAAQNQRDEAVEKLQKAQAELEKVKQNPNVPKEIVEKLKADAEAAAAAANEEKIKALEKQLLTANPDMTVFKTYYAEFQESFNRLHGALLKVAAVNAETGTKLTAAIRAALEQMGGKL